MANISKITLPSGTTYEIADSTARADIANLKTATTGGIHYLGTTTSAISDGSTLNPIKIGENDVTAVAGDLVIKGELEFIWDDTSKKWHEFGSTGSLKKLAFKDSASATYTPAGTITDTFKGTQAIISSSFTPAGTVAGTVTAVGTNAASDVTITPKTTTVYSMTGAGSVTAGKAASCTLPSFSSTVSGETLTLSWSAGAFTANTPTRVTLPTRTEVGSLWNGVTSATAAAQTFTGTSADITATFAGTEGTATATYTPAGTNTATFKGTQATITVQ